MRTLASHHPHGSLSLALEYTCQHTHTHKVIPTALITQVVPKITNDIRKEQQHSSIIIAFMCKNEKKNEAKIFLLFPTLKLYSLAFHPSYNNSNSLCFWIQPMWCSVTGLREWLSPYLNLVVLIYLLVEPRRRRKAHILERDLTLWLPTRTEEYTLTDKSENLITGINIFASVTCRLCCTFHENYSLVFKCHSDWPFLNILHKGLKKMKNFEFRRILEGSQFDVHINTPWQVTYTSMMHLTIIILRRKPDPRACFWHLTVQTGSSLRI